MCFPSRQEPTDINSALIGNLVVKLTDLLPASLDTIVVTSNPSLQIDPFESTFQTKPMKQKLIIDKGTVKQGEVVLIKTENRNLVYMNLPDKDKALLDFKTHNGITKALEKAFQYATSPKIGFSKPSYAVLNIDQKLYQNKMVNALKLFSINAKKGIVYVELSKNQISPVLALLKKKTFQKGECDEQ